MTTGKTAEPRSWTSRWGTFGFFLFAFSAWMCLITPKGSTLWPIAAIFGMLIGILIAFAGFTLAAIGRAKQIGQRLKLENLRASGFSIGDLGHADLKGEFQGMPVRIRLKFNGQGRGPNLYDGFTRVKAENIARISMTNDCGSLLTLRITARSSNVIRLDFDPVIEGPWPWAKGFKIQGAPEEEALRLLNSLSEVAPKLLETKTFRELSVDSGTCTATFAQAGMIAASEISPWLDFCALIARRL